MLEESLKIWGPGEGPTLIIRLPTMRSQPIILRLFGGALDYVLDMVLDLLLDVILDAIFDAVLNVVLNVVLGAVLDVVLDCSDQKTYLAKVA